MHLTLANDPAGSQRRPLAPYALCFVRCTAGRPTPLMHSPQASPCRTDATTSTPTCPKHGAQTCWPLPQGPPAHAYSHHLPHSSPAAVLLALLITPPTPTVHPYTRRFRLISYRYDVAFAFLRNGFDSPVEVARSKPIKVRATCVEQQRVRVLQQQQ